MESCSDPKVMAEHLAVAWRKRGYQVSIEWSTEDATFRVRGPDAESVIKLMRPSSGGLNSAVRL